MCLTHPSGWYPLDAKFGEVVSMVLHIYRPTEGQALYVDNGRLSGEKPTRNIFYDPLWGPYCIYGQSMFNTADFLKSGKLPEFRVAGTDLVVADCAALAAKLKDKWTAPAARTLDQVEADFQKKYEETKKKHPKAVLAVFRDGQPGYDPANPEKIYLGWKDAHLDCHSPDGPLPGRENSSGKNETLEVFMRHRALLAQTDLSSIPQGSTILAAQLVLNRVPKASRDATKEPTMWVAEPCMRDWNEYEVNCYQYAAGKLWKAMSGCYYYGDDPDFLPLFIAHGLGQGPASVWDFTEAVRFWTDGKHINHGFLFHGDSKDYFLTYSREHKEVKVRPAMMVIYEPETDSEVGFPSGKRLAIRRTFLVRSADNDCPSSPSPFCTCFYVGCVVTVPSRGRRRLAAVAWGRARRARGHATQNLVRNETPLEAACGRHL